MILVRYAEIGIKGKNRGKFERMLMANVQACLINNHKSYTKIFRMPGRILVETDEECLELLKVFGIASMSNAKSCRATMQDMENIVAATYLGNVVSGFRISCSRLTKTTEFTSQDVCRNIGAFVVKQTGMPVNLSKPNYHLRIEINGDKAYIYDHFETGLGGLPLGSTGRIGVQIKDYHDIVAAWHMMRRGCMVTVFGDVLPAVLERYTYGQKIILCSPHLFTSPPRSVIAMVSGDTVDRFKKIDVARVIFRPLIGMEEKEIQTWYKKICA